MKNNLFVLSGPSGVGKGTIAKMLIERCKNVAISISCTTRAPRVGEVEGKDYFFLTKEQFNKKIAENGFLEYSNHFENYYGTPKDYVEKTLKEKDVLLEIDVNGGEMVKQANDDVKLIFLAPPSVEELRNRLIKRNTEPLEKINIRLARLEYETQEESKYDYVVVNDNLETAYQKIVSIIENEKKGE